MLKRGVTLVTVYLEPGLRASGLKLWLLEVLAACIFCFDGPLIAMGNWNMEPKDLVQAGWLDTVNGKVAATSLLLVCWWSRSRPRLLRALRSDGAPGATGQGGEQLTHNSALISMSHPQGHVLESQGIGPQTAQAFPNAGASGSATPGRAIRMDLGCRGAARRFGVGVAGMAARSRSCLVSASTIFAGPIEGLFWEGAKVWSSSTFPSAKATRNDARRHCSKKAAAWRALRRLVAHPVGSLAAWRKGRASQGTLQHTVDLLASSSLPDLGPWDPGWDFPSQQAVAHTLHKAATCGDWASQATKVMVFIKLHTQQAVNAAAADSAPCWRRWAKEACQGSAGAAHGFSKAGLDPGDSEGLAGPQLLVNQMGTWLPLWLDSRRANAKQLADQEDMGEPLLRPSLEEVDKVCKTYKHTAGLGHDCINLKAILQLPVDLRVRFIDLLMAFEAKLSKPLNWSHMMVLRPKPSGGHRTIGLTVAPLRVLSRLRRPLAQQWENEHDAPYFWGCQGKACDRAAWAHSIMVALQGASPKPSSTVRTSPSMPHCNSWRRSGSTSAIRHATWGPICSWGRRRRALVVKGRLARASKRTKRVRQLRKAGAHTGKLTLTGSNVGVLWGSEVLGFTPTQLQSIRVDAAKATYRLSRWQNAATTMLANAQARGQKHRPGFSTSPTGHLGLGDGSLGRHSRPRHHAGCAARLPGQAQPSQAAVVRSNGRSGYFRSYASALGLECAVTEAPHDPRRHQDRPPGRCAQDGGPLGGPGIPSVD